MEAAGSRIAMKKMQTWTFAFFSTFQHPATAGGCSFPFEPFKEGFATVATMERREWREQTPPFFFVEGEARRRGGGTIYATANLSPKYAHHEG